MTGYILEKQLATSSTWEKVATVESSVTLFQVENLKEKSEYYFRISAENEVGASEPSVTQKISLKTHARKARPMSHSRYRYVNVFPFVRY